MSFLASPLPECLQRRNQPNSRLCLPSLDREISTLKKPASLNRCLSAKGGSRVGGYAAAVSVEAPLTRLGKSITVLLAEERTIVRQGIDALLAVKEDITVVGQATDFRQAFALAEKLRPDVVIIAISMALRTGLEALRRIFETRYGSRLLVLVPHNGNNSFAAHVAASGAAGCLTEQAGSQLLATAVREVHGRNQFFGPGGGRPAESQPPARQRGAAPEKAITRLTSRECEVLQLIAEGNANKQTASRLSISVKTVEKHRQHLMDKLGIHETATLTRYAVYAGIA